MTIKILEYRTWREHGTLNTINVVTVEEKDLKRQQEYDNEIETDNEKLKRALKTFCPCEYCRYHRTTVYTSRKQRKLNKKMCETCNDGHKNNWKWLREKE